MAAASNVSDQDHHRVLVYNSLADGATPVAAIGRPDLTTTGPAPPAGARTMSSPVACGATHLAAGR
ncbi:MAG: hypothetical protein NZ890_03450 [Myxococcota bacterium]|nr:hypothetical protein [Myxococcota bacterium]